MKKEIIIVIIVIILVVILNILTSKNTEKVINEMLGKLEQVRSDLINKEEDKMQEKMNDVKEIWNKEKDLLSVYIEHKELDEIEMYMTNANTDIEMKNYNMAIEALDTCTFIVCNIKDKYKLSIKNIF